MKKFKFLRQEQWNLIGNTIKSLLHASRDCYRNQGLDTTKMTFDCRDGYYSETFGMLRTLDLLGYGTINQAINTPQNQTNLRWWLSELEKEVLNEEGYGSNNQCDHCFNKWRKDSVRNYTPKVKNV